MTKHFVFWITHVRNSSPGGDCILSAHILVMCILDSYWQWSVLSHVCGNGDVKLFSVMVCAVLHAWYKQYQVVTGNGMGCHDAVKVVISYSHCYWRAVYIWLLLGSWCGGGCTISIVHPRIFARKITGWMQVPTFVLDIGVENVPVSPSPFPSLFILKFVSNRIMLIYFLPKTSKYKMFIW